MFRPKHKAVEVAIELIEGLRSGEITLDAEDPADLPIEAPPESRDDVTSPSEPGKDD